ncbi:MAG: hypothetical protein OXF09_02435, partial [Hyphomicrobiales bacterium]|nr:hypothetical protein [Hyphomicrobiales bacterium]
SAGIGKTSRKAKNQCLKSVSGQDFYELQIHEMRELIDSVTTRIAVSRAPAPFLYDSKNSSIFRSFIAISQNML